MPARKRQPRAARSDISRSGVCDSVCAGSGGIQFQLTDIGDLGEPLLLVDFCLRPERKSARPRTHVGLKLAELPWLSALDRTVQCDPARRLEAWYGAPVDFRFCRSPSLRQGLSAEGFVSRGKRS